MLATDSFVHPVLRCPHRWGSTPELVCRGALSWNDAKRLVGCDRCNTLYPVATWGVHLAVDAASDALGFADQERRSQYRRLHFGGWSDSTDDEDVLTKAFGMAPATMDFYAKVAWELNELGLSDNDFILDIGCAAGRSTFEATKLIVAGGCVMGVDISVPLLELAASLRGPFNSPQPDDRALAGKLENEFGEGLGRAVFVSMDATNLALNDGSVDIVLALNVVDRVPDPHAMMSEIERVLRKGGHLAISSPFDWPKDWADDIKVSTLGELFKHRAFETIVNRTAVPWAVPDATCPRELHLYACEFGVYRKS